jgi:hypothetical protein
LRIDLREQGNRIHAGGGAGPKRRAAVVALGIGDLDQNVTRGISAVERGPVRLTAECAARKWKIIERVSGAGAGPEHGLRLVVAADGAEGRAVGGELAGERRVRLVLVDRRRRGQQEETGGERGAGGQQSEGRADERLAKGSVEDGHDA